jgi:hypothetical protein
MRPQTKKPMMNAAIQDPIQRLSMYGERSLTATGSPSRFHWSVVA